MQQQQQLVKKKRRMFTSSDDNAMMKQVVATHSPDGREVELEHIFHVIEETLHHAIPADIDGVINVCTILYDFISLVFISNGSKLAQSVFFNVYNLPNHLLLKFGFNNTVTVIIFNREHKMGILVHWLEKRRLLSQALMMSMVSQMDWLM